MSMPCNKRIKISVKKLTHNNPHPDKQLLIPILWELLAANIFLPGVQ
jgi:hypothetical protein